MSVATFDRPLTTTEMVADVLKNNFPGGHPDFIPMAVKEVELHARKNSDYAKGGDPLGNFHRVASILSLYPGLDLTRPVSVAIVYMLKQLDAALYMLSKGYEGQIEGVDERLTDVHVYAKLARILAKEKKCN